MNEHNSDARDFRADYAALELKDHADWETVRSNYRRLVHLWHPDRYALRPRERVHAQQIFITLTKSYTHLRHFYRQYGRLPFEHTGNRSTRKTMDIRTPDKSRERARDSGSDRERERERESDVSNVDPEPNAFATEPDVEHGVLSRGQTPRAPGLSARSNRRLMWTLASCAIIVATLGIFFLLDSRTNQAIMERGKEVVREAPASEFMPSAAEIRRTEAKGAFVQPTR